MSEQHPTDAFDRAVAHEKRLRSWAQDAGTPGGVMRMAALWVSILASGWAVFLALHWLLFPDPRWLVLVHTIAFALTVGYWLVSTLFVKRMIKRMPMVQPEP